MATQVQWRRGTHAQVLAFTGAIGEVVIDTDQKRLVVQDGVTAGGYPAAQGTEITAVEAGVQQNAYVSGVAGGTGDAITITLSPAPTSYATLNQVWFKATAANTLTAPTINVNGLGAKTIQKGGGALAPGDIQPGTPYELIYDGTNYQLFAGVGAVSIVAGITRNPQTANYTTLVGDKGNLIDCTGTFTLTLMASPSAGFWFYVRNSGTGNVTWAGTIDAVANWVMYPGETRIVLYDGAAWRSLILEPGSVSFTANGTFIMAPGYEGLELDGVGGGGGGQGGSAANGAGAGGGGGGRYQAKLAVAAGTSVSITVGAGGAAGAANGGNGGIGGNTTFGALRTWYGGGAGNFTVSSFGGAGGGGAGTGTGSGSSGQQNDIAGGSRQAGGGPDFFDNSSSALGVSGTTGAGGGKTNTATATGQNAEWGGGGGGGGGVNGTINASPGGSSLFGPGGGGGGGAATPTGTAAAGGASGSYIAGGGGTAGAITSGAPGGAGASGSLASNVCGAGGGGGGSNGTVGGVGGVGGTPGGGGGGGGQGGTTNAAGGVGGRGELYIRMI